MVEATTKRFGCLSLGILDDFTYTSSQFVLEPGDSFLTFTDGVPEAMDVNNVQLQTRGILAAVQGKMYAPRELGEQVIRVVKQFACGRSQHDDIALVGFGRAG